MTRVTVTIDRVVLHGLAASEQRTLMRALESELSRVLADPATGLAGAQSRRIAVLNIGRVRMEAGAAGASKLGGGIARAIGKGVKP
ncbi:hypothetical protein SB861_40165 [Paraburkholderia sp. SIMBA_049]